MRTRSNRSVSLLTWGFNEELLVDEFFEKAINLLDDTVNEFEIIFVDDGSTDNTPLLLRTNAAKDSRIRIITNKENLNVGLSCRVAINAASKEILFWQTMDWSYDLTNLKIFLSLLDHYDVVQGIRPTPIRLLSYIPVIKSIYRIRTRSDSFYKAIISLVNYYLLRTLFGAPFQDFQNITFYRTALVQSLSVNAVTPFINPELLIRTYYQGCSLIEVPIPFIPRILGMSKGTKLPIVIKTLVDIIKNWLLWGWNIKAAGNRNKIARVSQPFELPEKVLKLTIPLFSEFR